jgi:hypothetical protein
MPVDRRPADPLSATVDALAERATDLLTGSLRRARMHLREQDALARLGLDIILSTQREMLEAKAYDALRAIPAVATGEWWLAPSLRLAGRGCGAHVVASGARLASVQVHDGWDGAREGCGANAAALLALVDTDGLDAITVESVADPTLTPGWTRSSSGGLVAVTPIDRVAATVVHQLHLSPKFDAGSHPRLARAMFHAIRASSQRSAAIAHLARDLDSRRWLVAENVRLPGLDTPVGVLVAGPAGVYVCEAEGLDALRATAVATRAASHLAWISRGARADVTPVVLCEPGLPAHQLRVCAGRSAWALPLDLASDHIARADRAGLRPSQLRRVRRPAPGWEYRSSCDGERWTCQIRYDLGRHRRALMHH